MALTVFACADWTCVNDRYTSLPYIHCLSFPLSFRRIYFLGRCVCACMSEHGSQNVYLVGATSFSFVRIFLTLILSASPFLLPSATQHTHAHALCVSPQFFHRNIDWAMTTTTKKCLAFRITYYLWLFGFVVILVGGSTALRIGLIAAKHDTTL